MKVILVEPAGVFLMSRSIELRGNTLEPYACEVIAAYVQDICPNIEVLQQREENDLDFAMTIVNKQPDIVGFSVLTKNFKRALTMAEIVKAETDNGTAIVFGGYHPSIDTRNVIGKPNIDYVVFGEGEITFKELLQAILGKKNVSEIKGLAYKDNNGEIHINAPRERIPDLSILPPAKRDKSYILNSNNWNLSYPSPSMQTGVAQVQYSRGCIGRCTFCVTPEVWCKQTDINDDGVDRHVTWKSPKLVVREITQIRKDFGVNFFYFNDVTFNYSEPEENQMARLCNALKNQNLHTPHDKTISTLDDTTKNIHWFCLAKIGLNNSEAKMLSDAGCSKIGFGIESFDSAIKEKYHKPYKLEDIENTLKNTDEYGIINRVYIVIGSPWETKDSIDRTLEGLLKYPVDQIRVAFAVPYKGSEADKSADWKKIVDDTDYDKFDEDEPIILVKNMTKEESINFLKESRNKLIKGFYNSDRYKERVQNKIERFPYLEDSYKEFDDELRMLSGNTIHFLPNEGH